MTGLGKGVVRLTDMDVPVDVMDAGGMCRSAHRLRNDHFIVRGEGHMSAMYDR